MPLWLNLLLIVIVGSLSAWLTWVVAKPVNGSLLMLAFTTLYIASCAFLYVRFRIWVPIVVPMFCAGLTNHVSLLTYRLRVEQSQKRISNDSFRACFLPTLSTSS